MELLCLKVNLTRLLRKPASTRDPFSDSPYTAAISQGVIRLIEKGVVTRLKKKWWEEERGGGSCKDVGGASSDQMGVAALAGLYMMLIAGIVAATIIAVCEFTWRKQKLAVDENVSLHLLLPCIETYGYFSDLYLAGDAGSFEICYQSFCG